MTLIFSAHWCDIYMQPFEYHDKNEMKWNEMKSNQIESACQGQPTCQPKVLNTE